MVYRSIVLALILCQARHPLLGRGWTVSPFISRPNLRLVRTRLNAAVPAVKAHTPVVEVAVPMVVVAIVHLILAVVHNYRAVDVNVANHGRVHIGECGVIEKLAVVPAPAVIVVSKISIAVVHAAIKAHLRTPVSGVPFIAGVRPSPISRCPQQPRFRSLNPRPRNPIIAISAPRPVARSPDIVRGRAGWLVILGQFRWSNGDRDSDLSKSRR